MSNEENRNSLRKKPLQTSTFDVQSSMLDVQVSAYGALPQAPPGEQRLTPDPQVRGSCRAGDKAHQLYTTGDGVAVQQEWARNA